jgi:hypothetical protein
MGFASGDPVPAITASPMFRVSKRLAAKVFHGPEIEAGTSAADAAHIEAARLLQRQMTSATRLVSNAAWITGNWAGWIYEETKGATDRGFPA